MRFGVFELDLQARELRKHGVRIRLTGQPYQVLVALLERPGEVVTRESLRQVLWPEQPWGDHDHRLNKVVNKVRESLSDSADMPRYVETLPRLGYRFLVPVQVIADAVSQPEPSEASDEPSTLVEAEPDVPPPVPQLAAPARGHRRTLIGISLAVVLAGAAVVWAVSGEWLQGRRPAVPTQLAGDSGSALYPAFSPDGKQIAYAWDGADGENFDIYVIETGTGRSRRLTFDPARDHSPAWSPEGREIAFVREIDGMRAVVMAVPATGGLERQVASIRGGIPGRPVAWTRNPRRLIACDRRPDGGPVSLYIVSTDSGTRRQLTKPERFGDLSPAVSPDGRRLAFTRATSPGRREIFVLDLSQDVTPAGDPRQVSDFHRRIDTLTWTSDGRELIFSAEGPGGGSRYLYRIAASGSGSVRELADIRVEGTQPSISPDGRSLAYSRRTAEQSSIWRLEPFSQKKPERLAVSMGKDWTADVSPDCQRIVFASSWSGPPELWVSAIDGSDLKRAALLGETGAHAPRWSPDGRKVVFEARPDEQWDLYIVDAGGRIQRLTAGPADDIRPSWSADGRFVYFCSARTGRPEIWKVPSSGGKAIQVTHQGGSYALESFDGKTVYYTSAGQAGSLRRVAAGGGEETDVMQGILGSSGIALSGEGIFYYAAPARAGSNAIFFYSFSARTSRPVKTIEHPVSPMLSLSGDGRHLLYTQIDRRDSEIVLLENFR